MSDIRSVIEKNQNVAVGVGFYVRHKIRDRKESKCGSECWFLCQT